MDVGRPRRRPLALARQEPATRGQADYSFVCEHSELYSFACRNATTCAVIASPDSSRAASPSSLSLQLIGAPLVENSTWASVIWLALIPRSPSFRNYGIMHLRFGFGVRVFGGRQPVGPIPAITMLVNRWAMAELVA